MLHTIENENLICTIESKGAEVRSLINKKTGEEYIWQINSSIWASSAPILFPSIGKIKDNKVVYKGKDFAMPKHGIIRHNDLLSFEQNHISKCTFTLTSSEKTLKQYPFKFSFAVNFEITEKRLIMTYNIENRDTASMHFTCGGHTAYACTLNEDITLSDYLIEFPSQEILHSNTIGISGLLTHHKRKIENHQNTLPLSNSLFDEDALVFSNIKYNWIRLRKKNKKKGILVRFPGYPNLALWSKPKANFICIEPWLGLPDFEDESVNITQKSTYTSIKPNTKFSISIETEIE